MKVLRTILLLLAVLSMTAFITGIEIVQWDSGSGLSMTHYHGWQRLFPFFVSAFCFSWLFAIVKRNIVGWYIGSVVFILAILQILILQGIVPFLSASNAADRWWALISQTIFALLLLLALVKWWLPKKRDFQPTDGA